MENKAGPNTAVEFTANVMQECLTEHSQTLTTAILMDNALFQAVFGCRREATVARRAEVEEVMGATDLNGLVKHSTFQQITGCSVTSGTAMQHVSPPCTHFAM